MVGLITIFFSMVVAAICLYLCYRRSMGRYTGYVSI
jgi:hypothetical protein